ncbi:aspartic peptidase domain-containing protein [Xylaria sp. FL0043]|nr:aspartic peptidase domain-containing protein [Xylaria sp. FL0043]
MSSATVHYFCLVLVVVSIQLWTVTGYETPGFFSLPIRAGVTPARLRPRFDRRSEDIYSFLSGNSTTQGYYIDLYLGNPPNQKVEVLLGTSYNDFWVNPNCSDSWEPIECETRGFYDPTLSSTSEDTGVNGYVGYDDGSWANFSYYTDQVSLSSGRGPSNVRFGVATDSGFNPSGILGLGLGAASENGGDRNFIDQLADQQFTNSKAFSLALGNGNAEDQGVVIFGGIDTKKFAGKLVPNEIQPPQGDDTYAQYDIEMTGLGLTSSDGTSNSYTSDTFIVGLDAGTSFSYIPESLVVAINNDLQAMYDETTGATVAPCAQRGNNSQLVFTFGSTTIHVPFSEILAINFNETLCFVGILPQGEYHALLGINFLRSAYVVFDQTRNEISMQQYVNCGTNEQVILSSGADGFVGECNTTSPANATSSISTPTATPTATPSPDRSTSGLSTGAKAGVGVGVAAGALLILSLLYYFLIRARRRAASQNVLEPSEAPDTSYRNSKAQSQSQYTANNHLSEVSAFTYDQHMGTPMAEAPASPQFPTGRESAQYWASVNEQWSPPAAVVTANTEAAAELEVQHSTTTFSPASSPAAAGGPDHRT